MKTIESNNGGLLKRVVRPRRKHDMSIATWMATEGGRKCPMCGRYSKAKDLGWIGCNTPTLCLDMYGHLPGKGCNRMKRKRPNVKGEARPPATKL